MENKLSKTECESFLIVAVKSGWLAKFGSDSYCLGPRSTLELQSMLSKDLSVSQKCKLCSELCVLGQICATEGCGVKMHFHCLRARLRPDNKDFIPKCMGCKMEWNQVF